MNDRKEIYMRHSSQYTFIALALLLLLSPADAAHRPWQTITDQDAGFKISFPGKPTYQQFPNPETGEPMEQYSFQYNGHQLVISISTLDDPPRTAAEVFQLLNNTAQVYATGAGTLLRQENLPGGGRQYDNIKIDTEGTLHLRTRLYIHNGKVYTITYGTYAAEGLDEQIAKQFFSSFNFINMAPRYRMPNRRDRSSKTTSSESGRLYWYTFKGPDSDFVVEFPGKPYYRVDTDTGMPYHQYIYSFGENSFIVAYRDIPNVKDSSGTVKREVIKNYVTLSTNQGWRVLREYQLPDSSYQIESQGMVNGYPVQMQTRLYFHSTRIYIITSMTKNLTGPNKDDITRFSNSFHLL
jgi:hypothetical protein